jgi:hypothetical protein
MSSRKEGRLEAEPEPNEVSVSAHRSGPDRIVLTEEDNTDGWIASDLIVELRP